MPSELTSAGIAALKAGKKAQARAFLLQATQADPTDELTWLWLSGAVEADAERRAALERVLEINPNSTAARSGLAQLLPAPIQPPVQSPAPALDEYTSIHNLQRLSSFSVALDMSATATTAAASSLPQSTRFWDAIVAAERCLPSTNPELHYWIGVALHTYVTWYLRGDTRKSYLEQAVEALKRAVEYADSLPWQVKRIPGTLLPIDQVRIRGELGRLVVDEALVRDLDVAITCLEPLFYTLHSYEPALCFYAEALYKRMDYTQAVIVGVDLHQRALQDPLFRDHPPRRPLDVAARSYRALYREAKRRKDLTQAAQWLHAIIDLGVATEHDKKLAATLK